MKTMVNNKAAIKQKALDYIMYMILASYFNKAVCQSPLREKQLFLCYKDIKLDEQLKMEEACIRYIEKFQKAVPESFWKQEVEVHFKGRNASAIEVHGNNQILCVRTSYEKGKPQFQIRLLTKKADEQKGGTSQKKRPRKNAA